MIESDITTKLKKKSFQNYRDIRDNVPQVFQNL
jgi:hypothetical protein